jgi:hypothetical protein
VIVISPGQHPHPHLFELPALLGREHLLDLGVRFIDLAPDLRADRRGNRGDVIAPRVQDARDFIALLWAQLQFAVEARDDALRHVRAPHSAALAIPEKIDAISDRPDEQTGDERERHRDEGDRPRLRS